VGREEGRRERRKEVKAERERKKVIKKKRERIKKRKERKQLVFNIMLNWLQLLRQWLTGRVLNLG
jgi:hypothetical protein